MVDDLAQHATGAGHQRLSDALHPVQMLADLFTVRERFPDRRKVTMATSATATSLPLADVGRGQERPCRSAPVCPGRLPARP